MTAAQINRLFRAFSDSTRLRILHLLRTGEVCVGDLVRVLRLPQSTVSRHLMYLRRAGLVRVRKNGLWCFYTLAAAEGEFHRRLLRCLGSCFREAPELSTDAKKLAALRLRGGCCPTPASSTTSTKNRRTTR